MVGPLKNFLHFFTLKQGTVLIAIIQLLMSAYILVFYILGLTHVTGIQNMISRDTEDVLEREALEDISSRHINSQRMELARHNATEEIYVMYCGLGITVIHFITTVLLLYGALMNNRYFMAPWMMVMMTIIAALIISLFFVQKDCPFIALVGGKADIVDRLFILFLEIICIYIWLAVYSTYRSLEVKKGVIHEVHGIKTKYPQKKVHFIGVLPPCKNQPPTKDNKKSKSKLAVPRPFEV